MSTRTHAAPLRLSASCAGTLQVSCGGALRIVAVSSRSMTNSSKSVTCARLCGSHLKVVTSCCNARKALLQHRCHDARKAFLQHRWHDVLVPGKLLQMQLTCVVGYHADDYSLKLGDEVEMIRGMVLGSTGSTVRMTFQRPTGQEKKHHKPSGQGMSAEIATYA